MHLMEVLLISYALFQGVLFNCLLISLSIFKVPCLHEVQFLNAYSVLNSVVKLVCCLATSYGLYEDKSHYEQIEGKVERIASFICRLPSAYPLILTNIQVSQMKLAIRFNLSSMLHVVTFIPQTHIKAALSK